VTFEVEVDHVVAGRYRLGRLLGRGAMGEVWLATHVTLGEEIAIKFLRPEAGGGEDAASTLSRFLFEAKVAARLSRRSRHIVQVTDQGEEGGLPYLVMERLEGESLEERYARGPVPMATLQTIVAQCARGLGVAHAEGVFHRDLKPANVFLCKDDDGRLLVKLLDFGIARAMRPETKRSPTSTGRGVVLGTPSYMSPEQARGLKHLDHRCDVWALAVVAYEGLTAQIPFHGETVEDIYVAVCTNDVVPIEERRRGLGPTVAAFFARALTERITERFESAEELAAAFGALAVPDMPAAAATTGREIRADEGVTQAKLAVSMSATPRRRARAAWVAIGLVAALVVAALGAKVAVSSRTRLEVAAPPPTELVPVAVDKEPPVAAPPPVSPPPVVADPIPLLAASALPIAAPTKAPPARPAAPPAGPASAAAPPGAAPLPPRPSPPPAPPSPRPPDTKNPQDKSNVF
jgi:eukaryotic-like serine/threonine-protein kinase